MKKYTRNRRSLLQGWLIAVAIIATEPSVVPAEAKKTGLIPALASRLRSVPVSESDRDVVPAQRRAGGENSSVTRELQRLFNESGQPMPSMQTRDLPNATSPRMERIRRSSSMKPRASRRGGGLLKKLFGKLRRSNQQLPETLIVAPQVTPSARPILPRLSGPQPSQVRESHIPRTARTGGLVGRSPVSARPPAIPQPAMYRGTSAGDSVASGSSHRIVARPASSPAQSGNVRRPSVIFPEPTTDARPLQQPQMSPRQEQLPIVGFAPRDDFVSPFEESAAIEDPNAPQDFKDSEGNVSSDSSFETVQETPTEPQNPFTGRGIGADEEFITRTETESTERKAAEDFDRNVTDSHEDDRKGERAEPLDQVRRVESGLLQLPDPTAQLESAEETSVVREDTPQIEVPQASPAGPAMYSTAGREGFDEYVMPESDCVRRQRERREQQRQLIQSRRHQDGFMGFCLVALRDYRELVDHSDDYQVTFGLRTYQFSSPDAKAAFESDPTRYVPAAGGADVVALVNSGEEQRGSLEFAMWYRNRLYLFQSRETMAMFSNKPADFSDRY